MFQFRNAAGRQSNSAHVLDEVVTDAVHAVGVAENFFRLEGLLREDRAMAIPLLALAVYESIDRSDISVDRSIARHRLVGRLVGNSRSVRLLFELCRFNKIITVNLTIIIVEKSIRQSFGQSAHDLICRSVSLSVSPSASPTDCQSLSQSIRLSVSLSQTHRLAVSQSVTQSVS